MYITLFSDKFLETCTFIILLPWHLATGEFEEKTPPILEAWLLVHKHQSNFHPLELSAMLV